MTDINLLKYLNMSQSEIHQLENSERDVSEESSFANFLSSFSQSKYLYYLSAVFIAAAMVVFGYYMFKEPDKTNTAKTVENQTVKAEQKETKESNNLINSNSFRKIGSVSFLDNTTTEKEEKIKDENKKINVKNDNRTKPEKNSLPENKSSVKANKTVAKKANTDPNQKNIKNAENNTRKNIKKQQTKQNKKSYVIIINDINEQTMENIVGTAEKKGLKVSATVSFQKDIVRWNVYTPSSSGNIKIGSYNTELLKDFKTKGEAVLYAKEVKGRVFVKRTVEKYSFYDIKIGDFKNTGDARSFAETINAGGNVIKIVRRS